MNVVKREIKVQWVGGDVRNGIKLLSIDVERVPVQRGGRPTRTKKNYKVLSISPNIYLEG